MATSLTVINAALTRTGSQAITSLTEGTIGAQIAIENYEDIVRSEIAANPWKIATKVELLNLLAESEGTPPEPWLYAYQMPTDIIDLRTVKVSGEVIEYALMGQKLLCDYGSGSEVLAHYLWRVPENWWPAWFTEGMTRRMEAVFLRGIGERYEEAEARDAAAEDQFRLARTKDAQGQTPRDPHRSGLLAARGAAQSRRVTPGPPYA